MSREDVQIPIGTRVRVWPGVRPEGRSFVSTTRTPVWQIGDVFVVSVEDYPGGIALTHIEPTEDAQ